MSAAKGKRGKKLLNPEPWKKVPTVNRPSTQPRKQAELARITARDLFAKLEEATGLKSLGEHFKQDFTPLGSPAKQLNSRGQKQMLSMARSNEIVSNNARPVSSGVTLPDHTNVPMNPNTPLPNPPKRTLGNKQIVGDAHATLSAAYGERITNREPREEMITKEGSHGVRITHMEYAGEYNGTTNFTTFQLDASPTSDAFPWLSSVVPAWQYYHFTDVKMRLVTSRGSTEGGVVMVAPIGSPDDFVPANKAGLLNYVGAERAVAWQGVDSRIPKVMLNQVKKRNIGRGFNLDVNDTSNLSTEELASSTDPRFSSPAHWVVATDGYTTPGNAGEVWVCYQIELWSPRPIGIGIQSCTVNAPVGVSGSPLGVVNPRWCCPPGNLAWTVDPIIRDINYLSQTGDFLVVTTATSAPSAISFNALSSAQANILELSNVYDSLTWTKIYAVRVNDTEDQIVWGFTSTTSSNNTVYVSRAAPNSIAVFP